MHLSTIEPLVAQAPLASERTRVRAMRAADLAAVTRIYAEALAEGIATYEDEVPDEAAMGRRMAEAVRAELPALVAVDRRDRVLAFAWATPFRARSAYRATVEDSIYVDSRARGTGVGAQLLRQLVAECTKRGCRQMIAVVGDSRNRASIRLHERLGFVAAGYLVGAGQRPDGPVDVVMLQRALSAGQASALT